MSSLRHLLLPLLAALAASCGKGASGGDGPLLDPGQATQKAPETFGVRFDTTAGSFDLSCTRAWAPNGVDRFYNLVTIGYFQDVAFFRVVKTPRPFVAQFGLHGRPEVNAVWVNANLPLDEPTQSNTKGRLTFAMAGKPDTRATQLFFNLGDNKNLDAMGFAPICEVTGDGLAVLEKLNGEYGETPTSKQGVIAKEGNAFLRATYPKLDYIKSATLL